MAITIKVDDINDNPPEFTVKEINVEFPENISPGHNVIILPETIDRDQHEFDPSQICYYIVSGNEKGRFELLKHSHELRSKYTLDREETELYTIYVRATEDCKIEIPNMDEFKPDPKSLKVNIKVLDVNDNAPRFNKTLFTGGVSTDVNHGTKFMKVIASDQDEGENAVIEFTICSKIQKYYAQGITEDATNLFSVDAGTGDIIINFDPEDQQQGYFTFSVCAFDPSGKMDKADVIVYILREDQRVKFTTRSNAKEMRSNITKFVDTLESATASLVNVDHIRVHNNNDGTLDNTKTDIYLHFIHHENNTIMDVDEVLKSLDYKTVELDPFFKEFNVLQTARGVSSQLTHRDGLKDDPLMMLWLIGACAFEFLILLLLFCSCLIQNIRHKRKLKAITVQAYSNPTLFLPRDLIMRNSNVHAQEGSNPVWMTETTPWEDHDQSLTTKSPQRLSEFFSRFDSLDTNVLNDFQQEHDTMEIYKSSDGVYPTNSRPLYNPINASSGYVSTADLCSRQSSSNESLGHQIAARINESPVSTKTNSSYATSHHNLIKDINSSFCNSKDSLDNMRSMSRSTGHSFNGSCGKNSNESVEHRDVIHEISNS